MRKRQPIDQDKDADSKLKRYVREVQAIRESSPEMFEQLKQGTLTIPQAKRRIMTIRACQVAETDANETKQKEAAKRAKQLKNGFAVPPTRDA
ncbi:MAG: hypothetical protein WBX22_12635 [Silvibacterium sp.]